MKKEVYVILDNIRSVHNVGSIFRTSDAFGVTKIFLIGTTPTPLDRFGQKRNDVAKVALGAEENVEWEYRESIEEVIDELKKEGVFVYAIEQDTKSVKLGSQEKKENIAYIFGNEVNGISKDVLDQCDSVLEIPMQGKKESLNVSVTCGIVLFEGSKD